MDWAKGGPTKAPTRHAALSARARVCTECATRAWPASSRTLRCNVPLITCGRRSLLPRGARDPPATPPSQPCLLAQSLPVIPGDSGWVRERHSASSLATPSRGRERKRDAVVTRPVAAYILIVGKRDISTVIGHTIT
eukprot:6186518-Pleurochrysis_carterae.AAC.3